MGEYGYFVLFGLTQLAHSQEEIWTGFHKRWFVFKMPQWLFIVFESALSILIIVYIIWPGLPFAGILMPAFALIMLINGLGHVIWAIIERQYVPGLATAPLFLIIFAFYFADLVRAANI